MTSLKKFWPAIESLPSRAAVEDEWQALVRDDYRLIKPFLRPRKDRASSFPRPDGGLPFRVVEHGSDDFVGVCEETGDIMTLTKSQLVVYELDARKLGQSVADATGIDRSNGSEDWNGMMVHLGHFTSAAKSSYEAFLAFPNESDDVHRAVTQLIAEKRTPFILFAPTRQWLRRAAETAMRMHGCVFVALTDVVTAPRPGEFELLTPMDSIISSSDHDVAVGKGAIIDEPLAERAQSVLEAMLELGAIDSDHRRTTEEIALKAFGHDTDANALKSVMSELKSRQFIASKTGRGGGCWLKDSGRARAEKLRNSAPV